MPSVARAGRAKEVGLEQSMSKMRAEIPHEDDSLSTTAIRKGRSKLTKYAKC